MKQKFYQSFLEFRNLRSLIGMAMLLALGVILNLFSTPIPIPILAGTYVTLGFIPNALLGMMYGPVAGALAAGIGDILQFIVKPDGGFFFGFTLSAMLTVFLNGLFFYKFKLTIPRLLANRFLINMFVNGVLQTLWVSMMGGKSMAVLILPRLLKNLVLLPIESLILYLLLGAVIRIFVRKRIPQSRSVI